MNYTNKGTDGKTKIPNKPFTYVEIKTLSKWQPPPASLKAFFDMVKYPPRSILPNFLNSIVSKPDLHKTIHRGCLLHYS